MRTYHVEMSGGGTWFVKGAAGEPILFADDCDTIIEPAKKVAREHAARVIVHDADSKLERVIDFSQEANG